MHGAGERAVPDGLRFCKNSGRCTVNGLILSLVITVEKTGTDVRVIIPNGEISAQRLDSFLSWLCLEGIVERGNLTEESASQLADEIKKDWWDANRDRFITPTP